MEDRNAQIFLRVNGTSNAFMSEIGCKCQECRRDKKRAQTSMSLVLREDGHRDRHMLFDCGSHVVDSLIEGGFTTGPEAIFLTHEHHDHFGGIDRLVICQDKHDGPKEPTVYGTQETLDEGPRKVFPYLPVRYQECTPGTPVEVDFDLKFYVTPVSVYHGRHAKNPVIWVVDYWDPKLGAYKKVVFAWDLLHLVPRYKEEDRDSNFGGDVLDTTDLNEEHAKIFQDVEYLFLAGNTCTAQSHTGHMSIEAAFRFLIPAVNPLKTYIMHYSGHEDMDGPKSDHELEEWINETKRQYGLSEREIMVAHHGNIINL